MAQMGGVYTATWNNLDLGHTKEGYGIGIEDLWEEIKCDRLGKALYDLWFVGKLVVVTIHALEWAANIRSLMSQTGSLGGVTNIGKGALASFAKALVLTPSTGNADDTFTFHKTLWRGRTNLNLNTLPRTIPLELAVLPDLNQAAGEEFFTRSV